MKIMMCFDGSDASRRALEKGVELFKPIKPGILLTMISEVPSGDGGFGGEAIERGTAHDRQTFEEALAWLKGQGMEVDPVFVADGDSRYMIMKQIKSKSPDLLVCGRRGRGRLAEMVLGSVSAYLIRHAPCDVMVVH